LGRGRPDFVWPLEGHRLPEDQIVAIGKRTINRTGWLNRL
jgi:hypothetical protein